MKAMFEVIKYNGDNNTLVYRYPSEDFNTKSQLIVQQSQEAVFYSRGQLADTFTEGTYTLNTKNIPILSSLINLPFGKESPFSAVIYFVNKTEQYHINWGLRKVGFTEREFGALLNVGAHGTLTFKISDAKVFLSKLVGQKPSFTQAETMEFMKDFIDSRGRNCLANIFNTRTDFDIFTIEQKIDILSQALKLELDADFREYGLQLEKLLVTGVNKDEESLAYQQLFLRRQQKLELEAVRLDNERRKALQTGELELLIQEQVVQQDIAKRGKIVDSEAEAIKRQLEGYTYQQERGFDVAEKTAQNEGAGNFASAGMGLGMGIGAMGAAAQTVGGIYNDALSNINIDVNKLSEKQGSVQESDLFLGVDLGIGNDSTQERDKAVSYKTDAKSSRRERLQELKELFEDGLITQEEFDAKKKSIIDEV